MPLLLVVLFIAVPIVELYVIIQVGEALGLLPTLAILVADSILGSMLMRSQGRTAWRRFNAAISEGRPPAREALDGVLVIFGGALLLTPGFVTDVFGLLLLLPPTRAVIRRGVVRHFSRRMVVTVATPPPPRRARRGPARPGDEPRFDVEGSAREIE